MSERPDVYRQPFGGERATMARSTEGSGTVASYRDASCITLTASVSKRFAKRFDTPGESSAYRWKEPKP